LSAKIEAEYFDGYLEQYGEFDPFEPQGWMTIREGFQRMVAPDGKKFTMLDVGCGTGQSRQIYAGFFGSYTGIDLSGGALRKARAKFPQDTWQEADACAMPFPDACFDLVAFSSVLHHIPVYADALKECHRVLKPGGQVFAFDPNLLHPAMALFRSPKSPLYIPTGVSPNERPLLPRDLRGAFVESGFGAIRQVAHSRIPFRAVAPKNFQKFLKLYNVLDGLWESVGLGRHFGTFVLTAGQKPL
jgi:SAM-dependent methyltransferase